MCKTNLWLRRIYAASGKCDVRSLAANQYRVPLPSNGLPQPVARVMLQSHPPAEPQWLALSDHPLALDPAGIADVVQRGSFVVELIPPKDSATVLLDYKTNVNWPRAFSIFQDPAAGIIVLHRQADTLLRHHLPGPLPCDWELARLTYTWDGPARTWSLRLEDTAGTWAHQAHGTNPMPMTGADIMALCAGQNLTRKHPSVQWFGICLQPLGPTPKTWFGKRTPIDTTQGPVVADDLRPGHMVMTRDNGPKPLHAIHKITLPNRARFAPVLLRAPYFARYTDLLVAPGQLTLLSGVAVEYLFGEEAVLAPASALRDGNTALTDARRPTTACIALELATPDLIIADGCPLMCSDSTAPLPYRLLQDYETLPLQSLLGRGGQRNAA